MKWGWESGGGMQSWATGQIWTLGSFSEDRCTLYHLINPRAPLYSNLEYLTGAATNDFFEKLRDFQLEVLWKKTSGAALFFSVLAAHWK